MNAAAATSHFEAHFGSPDTRNLERRGVSGGLFTLGSQLIKLVLQIGAMAALGRLLLPADFGIFGIVMGVAGIAALIQNLGLSAATIQRATLTHREASGVFWINLTVSATLGLLLAAASPAIAWVFGEPKLVPVTLVVAFTFFTGGLTAQHEALLRRTMKFRMLAVIDVLCLMIALVAGITAAIWLPGYWAPALQHLAFCVAYLFAVWAAVARRGGWIPMLPHTALRTKEQGGGIKQLLRFGGNVTGFEVLNHMVRNSDNLLIGGFAGTAALGFYTRAYGLLLQPLRQVTRPIAQVAVPGLSRLQDQPERYTRFYYGALEIITLLTMPMVAACFVFADDAVLTVLGPGWEPAAFLFRLLAIGAFVDTFNTATGWAFISIGHVHKQLRWQLLESVMTLLAFAVGAVVGSRAGVASWLGVEPILGGAAGVAIAFSASRLLMRGPALMYCYRDTPLTLGRLGLTLMTPAFASLAAAAVLWLAPLPEAWASPMRLIVGLAAYSGLYGVLVLLTPRGRALAGMGLEKVRTRLSESRTAPLAKGAA
ncbi:MAG: lipopolysaccharide biosynthesis protein [Planctomycetota bacterium]